MDTPPAIPPPHEVSIGSGLASIYADDLRGHKTASGEFYDPHRFTCAHRTLPLGTKVHIRNRRSGAWSTCRVNDRGPFAKGRVIDVSRAVGKKLGADGPELLDVELKIVR